MSSQIFYNRIEGPSVKITDVLVDSRDSKNNRLASDGTFSVELVRPIEKVNKIQLVNVLIPQTWPNVVSGINDKCMVVPGVWRYPAAADWPGGIEWAPPAPIDSSYFGGANIMSLVSRNVALGNQRIGTVASKFGLLCEALQREIARGIHYSLTNGVAESGSYNSFNDDRAEYIYVDSSNVGQGVNVEFDDKRSLFRIQSKWPFYFVNDQLSVAEMAQMPIRKRVPGTITSLTQVPTEEKLAAPGYQSGAGWSFLSAAEIAEEKTKNGNRDPVFVNPGSSLLKLIGMVPNDGFPYVCGNYYQKKHIEMSYYRALPSGATSFGDTHWAVESNTTPMVGQIDSMFLSTNIPFSTTTSAPQSDESLTQGRHQADGLMTRLPIIGGEGDKVVYGPEYFLEMPVYQQELQRLDFKFQHFNGLPVKMTSDVKLTLRVWSG